MTSTYFVCAKCGGKNVQHAMWVELNTDTPQDPFGTWCNGDNSFCADCDDHTDIDERPIEGEPAQTVVERLNAADLPQRANEAAHHSPRKGAPSLTLQSTQATLIAWLLWCDPNGSWTDHAREHDDLEPLTVEQAWLAIEELLDNA